MNVALIQVQASEPTQGQKTRVTRPANFYIWLKSEIVLHQRRFRLGSSFFFAVFLEDVDQRSEKNSGGFGSAKPGPSFCKVWTWGDEKTQRRGLGGHTTEAHQVGRLFQPKQIRVWRRLPKNNVLNAFEVSIWDVFDWKEVKCFKIAARAGRSLSTCHILLN